MVSPTLRMAEPMDVTISDGTSITAAINLAGYVPIGVYIPASWTTAALTFQMRPTADGTFVDMYDASGDELSYTAASGALSSKYLAFDPAQFYACQGLKIRSGTTATPVNQSGDITLTLMVARPTT